MPLWERNTHPSEIERCRRSCLCRAGRGSSWCSWPFAETESSWSRCKVGSRRAEAVVGQSNTLEHAILDARHSLLFVSGAGDVCLFRARNIEAVGFSVDASFLPFRLLSAPAVFVSFQTAQIRVPEFRESGMARVRVPSSEGAAC